MKESSKAQRQAERDARKRLREQRSQRIRTVMSAQRKFMDEYVRSGGDVRSMQHPLATAMLAAKGTEAVKAAINDFYAALHEADIDGD